MLLPALLATLTLAVPGPTEDGEALLRRINAAHKGSWFTTLTFVQRTTWPGGQRAEETWYESMQRPGMLRLDMMRGDEYLRSVIFRNDSLYESQNGAFRPGRPLVHPLLVLLHDIHVGDIDAQIAKLKATGFDLTKTHAATWQGNSVTVVGAEAGDSTSNQFWVDHDRLVVVRIVQVGQGGNRSDIHIGGFQPQAAGGMVESDIRFHSGGTMQLHEEYGQIQTGMALPATIFDPAHPELPEWVVKARGQ